MNKVFNDEKPSAFSRAVQGMPSHNGVPCTEDHIYTGETMACADVDEEPAPGMLARFLDWLMAPWADLSK